MNITSTYAKIPEISIFESVFISLAVCKAFNIPILIKLFRYIQPVSGNIFLQGSELLMYVSS